MVISQKIRIFSTLNEVLAKNMVCMVCEFKWELFCESLFRDGDAEISRLTGLPAVHRTGARLRHQTVSSLRRGRLWSLRGIGRQPLAKAIELRRGDGAR